MKVRDSGMPEAKYWESLFSIDKIMFEMEIDHHLKDVVEIGTGYGTFTIPTSKQISGTLYTYDIEEQCIYFSKKVADEQGRTNIQFIVQDILEQPTKHADESIDYIMLFNILHHEEPEVFLKESFRVLKKNGKLGVIHWNYDPTTPRGPSMEIRPKPEGLIALIEKYNFIVKEPKKINLPPYHYGILGIKK